MAAAPLEDIRLKNAAWTALCAVILLASPGFAAGAGASSGRTLYKWVDAQGVTHYGDRIPPEYAAQEKQVINSQGVEISRLEAQKSPEALAADEQRRAEAEQSQNRDRNLLNTYGTVQEIERLRDQRVTLMAEDLVRVRNDMHTQEENLREKRSEETGMSKKFDSDIARFKELKGIH